MMVGWCSLYTLKKTGFFGKLDFSKKGKLDFFGKLDLNPVYLKNPVCHVKKFSLPTDLRVMNGYFESIIRYYNTNSVGKNF